MTIIFNSLKESLNNIALLIEAGVEIMLCFEIDFVRDTSNATMLSDEKTNLFATVCFIRKNCFTLECNALRACLKTKNKIPQKNK